MTRLFKPLVQGSVQCKRHVVHEVWIGVRLNFKLLIVYAYWQPTFTCEIVLVAQKYSDATYTSSGIDATQISMGDAGRQGFFYALTLHITRCLRYLGAGTFFAFWSMKRLCHRVRACVWRRLESSDPWINLHSSLRPAICADDVYLCEYYHEQSNHIKDDHGGRLGAKRDWTNLSLDMHPPNHCKPKPGIRNASLCGVHGFVCRNECAPQLNVALRAIWEIYPKSVLVCW